MKTYFKIFISALISALVITACGGGGSSSGGGGGTPAGMFTKTVALNSVLYHNAGLFGSNDYRHYQLLYKPEDIAGSGYIKSIYFRYEGDSSATTCPHISIKLGHTSVEDLGTDMTLNINEGKGSAVTVLNDAIITIPAGIEGNYFEIPLSTQFNYNGVDNLIIDIARTAECSPSLNVRAGYGASSYTAAVSSDDEYDPNTANFSTNYALHVKFVFVGGDNKVDYNTTHDTSSTPFSTTPGFQKVQMLYNKDSIAGSGLITGIGLQVSADTTEQTYTYTMKLGHSTKTDLDTTWTGNFDVGSPVTVANALQFRIPADIPAGEFIWLPIPDGSFTYNGTDNLVIELTIEAADGNVSLATHTTSNYNQMYGNPANDQAIGQSESAYQIALRFYGDTVNVITDDLSDTAFIFGNSPPSGNSPNGRLNLYHATELGTAGTITSIACRLINSSSTDASYANFMVIIGHSAVNQLVENPAASNFISQTTAVNGTFSINTGLVKGDWIDIPLSTPFVYDGKSNLAIWLGTIADSGAAVSHKCAYSSILTRYTNQVASGAPGASAVNCFNRKLDMKFKILR